MNKIYRLEKGMDGVNLIYGEYDIAYENDSYVFLASKYTDDLLKLDRYKVLEKFSDIGEYAFLDPLMCVYLREEPNLSRIPKKPLYLCRIEELQNKIKLYEKSISESTKKITEIKSDIELYQHKIAELEVKGE